MKTSNPHLLTSRAVLRALVLLVCLLLALPQASVARSGKTSIMAKRSEHSAHFKREPKRLSYKGSEAIKGSGRLSIVRISWDEWGSRRAFGSGLARYRTESFKVNLKASDLTYWGCGPAAQDKDGAYATLKVRSNDGSWKFRPKVAPPDFC